jgi:hypothetical protein
LSVENKRSRESDIVLIKLMPVNPDNVRALVELRLIEMRDDVPVLSNEGTYALDWS